MSNCLWCGDRYVRLVPNVYLINAIQKHMRDVMSVKCLRCNKTVLVERAEPHGLRGTVRYYKDAGGNEHQEIFFADRGELIVTEGEPV